MKHYIYKSALFSVLLLFLISVNFCPVYAKNPSGVAAFDNLKWDKIVEKSTLTEGGTVQSICATADYIICLENAEDSSGEKDVAYAFYKNSVDENGNTVEQYSLAFTNNKWDWEQCSGMCYNEDTDEIYVALKTSNNPESSGCIYVMDPHTLDFKDSIKISDNYNILGIGYSSESDRYTIQANADGDYKIVLLDGNFNKIADFGTIDLGLGSEAQDLCVCGDYILNFPWIPDEIGIGNYMNVYNIDSGRPDDPDDYEMRINLLKAVLMELDIANLCRSVPKSICEIEDGIFLATVDLETNEGEKKFAWYRTELGGYYYSVNTNCINGTISATDEILKGGSYTVSYKPNGGFELYSICVDGESIEVNDYPTSYTFTDLDEDHWIEVEYKEIGASVEKSISEEQKNSFWFPQISLRVVVLGIIILLLILLLKLFI